MKSTTSITAMLHIKYLFLQTVPAMKSTMSITAALLQVKWCYQLYA